MNTDALSSPLKRNLKPGTKYNKCFPKVSCQSSQLGNGENNTVEGVDFMAQWVEKYALQVKKLVSVLKRDGALRTNTLQNTVNDVYSFCYHHLQYTADAALQQLRSPACAWQQRKQGVDCKSYSIFAMAMLKELGITAAIRQVRQPGTHSDLWTHVYIVVPKNQNNPSLTNLKNANDYLVIDATRHSNHEVTFIDKKDKMMQSHKYVGMNAPVGSVSLTQQEVLGFTKLTSFLKKVGYSQKVINNMLSYINELMLSGYSKNQILVFPSERGTNIQPSKTEAGKVFPLPNRGLNGGFDIDLGGFDFGGVFGSGNTNPDSSSTATSNIDLGEVYSTIKDSSWYDSTLGSIFANGFDLSCWNSNYNPNKAKAHLQKDIPGVLKASGLDSPSPNINDFNKFIQISTMYAHLALTKKGHMSASCSKKGYQNLHDKMLEFRNNIIGKMMEDIAAKGGQMLPDYDVMPQKTASDSYKVNIPGGIKYPITPGGWGGFDNPAPVFYSLIPFPLKKVIGGFPTLPPVTPPVTNTGNNNNNNNTGGGSQSNNSPTKNNGNAMVKQKPPSSTVSTASLGVAAGVLILVYPTIKKTFFSKKKK